MLLQLSAQSMDHDPQCGALRQIARANASGSSTARPARVEDLARSGGVVAVLPEELWQRSDLHPLPAAGEPEVRPDRPDLQVLKNAVDFEPILRRTGSA